MPVIAGPLASLMPRTVGRPTLLVRWASAEPESARSRTALRSVVFVDTCGVVEHSAKAAWVSRLPDGPPMWKDLARLVEEHHDEAETEYYEAAADPTFVAIERDQRRFRAMFRRRVRHRAAARRARDR